MNEAWTSRAACRAKLAMLIGGLSAWHAEHGKTFAAGWPGSNIEEILGMYDPSRTEVFYLCCQVGSLMLWLGNKEGRIAEAITDILDGISKTIDEGLATK